MDNKSLSSRRQNIFFNNLLALGFDVATMHKEHKLVFDKKMFLLPNRKGMEVVSHFLFSKLNEIAGGQFSIIWPLVDIKDQRQFQKTCFHYLTQIAQKSEIKFPPVLNSVFSSFGGEAFFDLYFAFSTHVVQQVNKTFGSQLRRPKFDHKLTRHSIEMLKLTSMVHVEKFQSLTDITKFHLETYFSIAKKLSDCVEKLKLSNSKSQSLLEEKIKMAIKVLNSVLENSLEGLELKNKEYQNKIKVLWRKLDDFLSKEEKMWGYISSELEDNTKPILKRSAYSFSLSNNLKNCYEERYQNELSEEGKHLCIPKFLKLFTVVLEFYVDSIKRGKFSETYNFQFLKDTSELDKSLKMLQSFCTLLEEGNEVNRKHVQTLKEKIHLNDFMDDKLSFIEDLPPSPEECLKPSVDFQNKNGSIFFYPSVQDVNLGENVKAESLISNSLRLIHQAPDENVKAESVMSSSLRLIHEVPDENDSVFSPIRTGEINAVTILNSELNYSDLNRSANEKTFYQTSSRDSAAKDSVLGIPEFDIPLGWLHEESLNSQTLSDQVSLSFLD